MPSVRGQGTSLIALFHFRYGDEQHLEEALDKIFKFGKAGGIPRKASPTLTGVGRCGVTLTTFKQRLFDVGLCILLLS